MIQFVSSHAGWAVALAVALATAGVLAVSWEPLALWLLSTWHSLPVIGGISWLARREKTRHAGAHSESPAVSALCSSYARFIRVLSRTDYDNYMNYLRKAGDLGRQPFPPYLRAVIFSMVLVEAAGLAYVLAGWTLPGASEFAQRIAAGGIGFLIAVILVFFTHWAGLEIDQCNRYRRDRNEWIAAGRRGPLFGPDLSLNDAQSVDDHEPAFRQRATRGHGKITYVMTTITLVMVVAVGSGAAFVRGQVIEQEILQESTVRSQALQRFSLSERDAADLSTDQRAIQEEVSIKRRGGWGTLIILGILFFFLQVLGIFFGYRHSFNGRLSKDAYRALRAERFSSHGELLQYYDRIADIAQSKLERLQQLLDNKHDRIGSAARAHPFTFRDYLQLREAQRRRKPLGMESETPAPDFDARPATLSTNGAAAAPATHNGVTAAPANHNGAAAAASASADPPRPPEKTAPPTAQLPAFESMTPNGASEESMVAPMDDLVLHNAEALLGPGATARAHREAAARVEPGSGTGSSARAQLEQAEKLERERAAERSQRGRSGGRRKPRADPGKTPAASESDAG